ncbi:uncharacterized protein At1g04910 isoform X2 [Amborella trichopoda]|uniref:O-fucosyltransferase family protein n=1 Tax=Amborella trichopoda TaxID=13333 RepID=W1NNT5_AMBTC|nr:uncharacterized protein At1g04910 isoform X2 [Amborella trichopoda]ERM97511.1 hypothetical protein AMTR_s00123p00071440 [Amborella trichopoda]|eukprot:XP_006830095.1 uncharacterized protein At1g04910 isoform X2 [Amborella trichopoda]
MNPLEEPASFQLRKLKLTSLEDEHEALLPELDQSNGETRDRETNAASNAWSSAFHMRSHSTTPRSRQGSPRSPTHQPTIFKDNGPLGRSSGSQSRFSRMQGASASTVGFGRRLRLKFVAGMRFLGFWLKLQGFEMKKKHIVGTKKRRFWSIIGALGLVATFFLMNWWILLRLQDVPSRKREATLNQSSLFEGEWIKSSKQNRPQKVMYPRLLALAAHALGEGVHNPEPKDLWVEPLHYEPAWAPCADQRNWEVTENSTGYIVVSANGGINQQRVAVCNAVAVSRLLNATLVVPKFLYSSVWRDESQFSDIYQEDHFINYLKEDIKIVKELPVELQSLDLEAIGSVVTDNDIMKESKPSFFLRKILPLLIQTRVVHFVGFGNRLAFDPIPFELQKLRCRCNFHALIFVHKIQEAGALIVQRMHQYVPRWGPIDRNLLGHFAVDTDEKGKNHIPVKASKYLALHLRFEIDMVAYSMCEFGGVEAEREELELYRSIHFPALYLLKKSTMLPSPEDLRSEGRCPLTPEEAVLVLAALGFKRESHIFVAGAHIYGGQSRMVALTSLYPNLVTKEDLLSSEEIRPFKNFSSQLAALDFIGCAAADAFAMTDSGSRFSSLVSGYRMYYGGGKLPTVRPNKRRLAGIFVKNNKIEWKVFEKSVRKAVRQSKNVHIRPAGRNIYRHPLCPECMCMMD